MSLLNLKKTNKTKYLFYLVLMTPGRVKYFLSQLHHGCLATAGHLCGTFLSYYELAPFLGLLGCNRQGGGRGIGELLQRSYLVSLHVVQMPRLWENMKNRELTGGKTLCIVNRVHNLAKVVIFTFLLGPTSTVQSSSSILLSHRGKTDGALKLHEAKRRKYSLVYSYNNEWVHTNALPFAPARHTHSV